MSAVAPPLPAHRWPFPPQQAAPAAALAPAPARPADVSPARRVGVGTPLETQGGGGWGVLQLGGGKEPRMGSECMVLGAWPSFAAGHPPVTAASNFLPCPGLRWSQAAIS